MIDNTPKLNQEQKNRLYELIEKLYLENYTFHDLQQRCLEWVQAEYEVSLSISAVRYHRIKCLKSLTDLHNIVPSEHYGKALDTYERIRERAEKAGDFSAALKAQNRLDDLRGVSQHTEADNKITINYTIATRPATNPEGYHARNKEDIDAE